MSIPLFLVADGKIAVIRTLKFEKSIVKKIQNIGVIPGSMVAIAHRCYDGTLIIKLDGLKIAISTYISQRILVSPIAKYL